MKKKLIALILSLVTVFVPVTALAVNSEKNEQRDWVDGDKYSVPIPDNFTVNGEEKLEFMLEFPANYVTIETKTPGTTIGFNIDGVNHSINLEEKSTKYTFPSVVRMGEKDLYITGNATITKIEFNEIAEETSEPRIELEMTDYQNAVRTATVIREGCPVFTVRGMARYYDYDNLEVKPVYVNGALYVPAESITTALQIYWEQDKDKNFWVMRQENTEIFCVDGNITYGYQNEYKPYTLDTQELYGRTYVPVRQIAEIFGNYVLYKDGYVVIDYRSRARNLVENCMKDLNNEFSGYMPKGVVGKTYYVAQSANASDNNDGSIDRPFATIKKASSVAQAGDTVIVREGKYRETVKPENDGTATAPITYKAMEGEEVYITPTKLITQFEEYEDGMLVASVPEALGDGYDQIFYKGDYLVEGRYPNPEVDEDGLITARNGMKVHPVWLTMGDLKVDNNDASLVKSDTLLQEEEEDYWKGAYFVTMHHYAWSLNLAQVKSSKKGELRLGEMSNLWFWKGTDGTNVGYLTGHVHTIDMPGEWAIDNNILYILPPAGETKDTLQLEYKTSQLVFDLNDRSYIHVEGFNTYGGSARMKNSTMCVINDCDMKWLTHYTFSDDQRNGYHDGNVKNLDGSPQRGEMGIYLGGENNALINSRIQYSAGAGVFMMGTNSLVDNNEFYDCDYMGSTHGAIAMDCEAGGNVTDRRGGWVITHNTVKRTNRSSLSLERPEQSYWPNTTQFLPFEIAYNDFSGTNLYSLDTGVAYMHGSDVGDTLLYTNFHNNFTYDDAPQGEILHGGFYNDNWMMGTDSYDNMQFASEGSMFMYSTALQQSKQAFKTTYATTYMRRYVDLNRKENVKDDLVIEDFPMCKPFQVGATGAGYHHDMTYDYYKQNAKTQAMYYVEDMVLSDGVEFDGQTAKFTSKDQWIKIENVDFDKYNRINLSYLSDFYHKGFDYLDVLVGDDINNPLEKKTIDFRPETRELDEFNVKSAYFSQKIEGKQTVWIRPSASKAEGTYSNVWIFMAYLSTEDDTSTYKPADASYIEGGSFYDSGRLDGAVSEDIPKVKSSNGVKIAYGLWGGTYILYKDVTMERSPSEVTVTLGTGGQWVGEKIQIRIDSIDSEPIAVVEAKDNKWGMTSYTVKIPSIVAGRHDIYVTGEGDGLCVDFYSLEFK